MIGRPVGVVELRHLGHLVERLAFLRVVPGPDHVVALERGVRARVGLRRDPLHVAVGDVDALARLAVELPAVERAAQAPLLHPSADREVGAEVRAVRVHHVGRAVGRSVEHEVAVERVQGAHLAGPDLARLGHHEPAVRDRERIPVGAEGRRPVAAVEVDEQVGVARHGEPRRQPAVVEVRLGGPQLAEGDIVGRVGHRLPPGPRSSRTSINKFRGRRRSSSGGTVMPDGGDATLHDGAADRLGGRPRISRQMIAEAAHELGLDGLTLRAVADHLDVSIAALYHHVSGKEDLMRLAAEYAAARGAASRRTRASTGRCGSRSGRPTTTTSSWPSRPCSPSTSTVRSRWSRSPPTSTGSSACSSARASPSWRPTPPTRS